eukprot:Selendium_serpulae@DN5701_c0_g2_i1.p1
MSKLFRFDRHLVHRVYIRYEKHAESNQRNTPVAELITGKVVFPGKDELGMLRLFCKFTGTPKKDEVAFLQQLGESDIRSLQNPGKHPLDGPLKLFEEQDQNGMDLLKRMLMFAPPKRITASAALAHPFFDDLDRTVF